MSATEYLRNKVLTDEAAYIAAGPTLARDLGLLETAFTTLKIEFLLAIPHRLGEPIIERWATKEGWQP